MGESSRVQRDRFYKSNTTVTRELESIPTDELRGIARLKMLWNMTSKSATVNNSGCGHSRLNRTHERQGRERTEIQALPLQIFEEIERRTGRWHRDEAHDAALWVHKQRGSTRVKNKVRGRVKGAPVGLRQNGRSRPSP